MRIRQIGRAVACALVVCADLMGMAQTLSGAGPNPQDAKVVMDFEARVNKYLELRKKAAGKGPKPTSSSAKLVQSQQEMGAAVQRARAGAQQGEIFTPEIARYFRRQLTSTLAESEGAKIRASLRHAEPLPEMVLHVNEIYPEKEPLQTAPPTLLLNLPTLPKELQYRIVGHDLVLHDTAANLIVDFIPGAMPSS